MLLQAVLLPCAGKEAYVFIRRNAVFCCAPPHASVGLGGSEAPVWYVGFALKKRTWLKDPRLVGGESIDRLFGSIINNITYYIAYTRRLECARRVALARKSAIRQVPVAKGKVPVNSWDEDAIAEIPPWHVNILPGSTGSTITIGLGASTLHGPRREESMLYMICRKGCGTRVSSQRVADKRLREAKRAKLGTLHQRDIASKKWKTVRPIQLAISNLWTAQQSCLIILLRLLVVIAICCRIWIRPWTRALNSNCAAAPEWTQAQAHRALASARRRGGGFHALLSDAWDC